MEEVRGGSPPRPRLKVLEVCDALNSTGARYLVIGGIACILHGYVRATTDIDILIERTLENVGRVLAGLCQTGYGFARDWSPAEILSRPVTVIGDDPAVDIFLVAWTLEYEHAVTRASVVRVGNVEVPLIGLDDLIATKRTGRALDASDVEALEHIRRYHGGSAT